MNKELTQFLLTGAKFLEKNPNENAYQEIPRWEFFWAITSLTSEEDIQKAIIILEKIANNEISPTTPQNLKELVEALDQRRRQLEEAKVVAHEQVEETIRKIKTLFAATGLEKQYVQEGKNIYVAPQEPPETKAQETNVFLVTSQVTKPIFANIGSAFSSLPLQATKGITLLSQQAFGKKDAQNKTSLALAQIGVTAKMFQEATQDFLAENPQSELGVVNALLSQTSVLKQYNLLNFLNRGIYSTSQTKLKILSAPPKEPEREKARQAVFRLIIDANREQVVRTERVSAIPATATTPPSTAPTTAVTQAAVGQVKTTGQNILSKAAIAISRAPLEIGKMFSGSAQVAIGKGLQFGISGVGSFAGNVFNTMRFGGPSGGVGIPVAGAIPKKGGGILGGVGGVMALVILAPLSLIFLTGFTTNSNQKAYLGAEVEESRFISVSKTTPQTNFQNSDLPRTVEFTITVTAKSQKLTNVQVKDSFSVSVGNTTLPENSWTVPEITTDKPWTQKFSVELPNSIQDSLVINSINVTAEIEGQPSQNQTTSLVLVIGSPPQDCPSDWPISTGYVTQGPNGPTSHRGLQAIDIGGAVGTEVKATHKGTARYAPTAGGGKVIEISGFCNGIGFTSRYLHLNDYVKAVDGKEVTKGTTIGYLGNTGQNTTGPHLHYEFVGLKMAPPFIPVEIPIIYTSSGSRGCDSVSECNVKW